MFDNIADELDDGGQTDNNSNSGSGDDGPRPPSVNLVGESAIAGEIVDVGFAGDLETVGNLYGDGDGSYGGDFVFVLENPEVVSGTLFEARNRRDAPDNQVGNLDRNPYDFSVNLSGGKPSADFKVLPPNWDDSDVGHVGDMAKKVGGEYQQVGIEAYDSPFPSTDTTFEDALEQYDRVRVFVGSRAGRIMAESLDVLQGKKARPTTDGYINGVLEEDSEGNGRVASRPILHSELEGEQIAMMVHFGDMPDRVASLGFPTESEDGKNDEGNRTKYGDVLWQPSDDHRSATVLSRESYVLEAEDARADERYCYLAFDHVVEGDGQTSGGSGSSVVDTDFSTLANEAGEAASTAGGLEMGDLDGRPMILPTVSEHS